MTSGLRIVLACALLLLLAGAANCADIYPTVDFAFDAATCEYSWTVNYTADVNVYFNIFQVQTRLPVGSWTSASGAWSGSPTSDEAWTFTTPPNGDGTYALRWTAGSALQRTPAKGVWTGVYKVIVPNSKPIAGNVREFSTAVKYQSQPSYVPEMVPEPSSFVAMGSLLGLLPIAFRRKRAK